MIARRALLIALLLTPTLAHAADPTAAEIVAAVDDLRLPAVGDKAYKTLFRLTDGEGAKRTVDKVQVLVRGQSSLVQMLDGDKRGMKFLGTPQGYWLYSPNTRRAMRLTPQMMLRGNTSVGDISRLRFNDDYSAAFGATKAGVADDRPCWIVELKAKSPSATYASVILKVAKSDLAPISADLFAISGKKLKTVIYGAPKSLNGRRMLTTTTYLDGIDATKKTVVELTSAEPTNAPAGMFKPEALPADF